MEFNIYDHYRLQRIEKSLDHLRKSQATPNPFAPKQADIESLQAEVGELRLLVAVLYRLLLTKGGIDENEVHALVSSLDAADGRRDGQFQGDAISGAPQVAPPTDDNPFPKIRV